MRRVNAAGLFRALALRACLCLCDTIFGSVWRAACSKAATLPHELFSNAHAWAGNVRCDALATFLCVSVAKRSSCAWSMRLTFQQTWTCRMNSLLSSMPLVRWNCHEETAGYCVTCRDVFSAKHL